MMRARFIKPAVLLIIILSTVLPMTALAQEVSLVSEAATGAPGETITVNVNAERGDNSWAGLAFAFTYDDTIFKYKSHSVGTGFGLSSVNPNTPGEVRAVFANRENVSGDGTLLTMEFDIAEGAADGDYTPTLTASQPDSVYISGTDIADAIVTTSAGSMTVNAEASITRGGATTFYAKLADAVASVTDRTPTTIVLLRDISVSQAFEIADGRDITLDMNNKTMTCAADGAVISILGKLTLKGPGTIVLMGDAYLLCESKDTLIINGVGVSTIVNDNGLTWIQSAAGTIDIVMKGDDVVIVDDSVTGVVSFVKSETDSTPAQPPSEIDLASQNVYFSEPSTALNDSLAENNTVKLNSTASGNIAIPAGRTVDVTDVNPTGGPTLKAQGNVKLTTSSQTGFDAAVEALKDSADNTNTINVSRTGITIPDGAVIKGGLAVEPGATVTAQGKLDIDGALTGSITTTSPIEFLIQREISGSGTLALFEVDNAGTIISSDLWASGDKYYSGENKSYVVVATTTSGYALGGIKGKYAGGQTFDITNQTPFTQDKTSGLIITAAFYNTTVYIPVTGVTLDQDKLTLSTGGTGTLKAAVAPADATNMAVSWASSDEKIITVSGGVVTGVAQGTATITVTTADGGFTDTCEVTVADEPTDDGTILDYDIRSMAKGKKVALPKVPGAAGTWSVADTNIAVIAKDGKVKALDFGITELVYTVTSVDDAAFKLSGKALEPGKSYELIELRVRKAGELAKSITVKPKNVTLFINEDKAVELTPTVKPAKKALDKEVFWKSNKPDVVKVSKQGVVTAVSVGKAKITAMTTTLKKFTVDVTVKKPATVVTVTDENGVALKKATVAKGGSVQLKAVVEGLNPSGVTWTSKNPKIAGVTADGLVTGLKKGEAKIVAKADDGSGAKASVTVKVTNVSTEAEVVKPVEDFQTEPSA